MTFTRFDHYRLPARFTIHTSSVTKCRLERSLNHHLSFPGYSQLSIVAVAVASNRYDERNYEFRVQRPDDEQVEVFERNIADR